MKLGTLLLRNAAISLTQLEAGLRAQVLYGGRLGTNLVELGFVDVDGLASYLGELTGLPVASRAMLEAVSPAAVALIDAGAAERLGVLPLGVLDTPEGAVALAMIEPSDTAAIGEIEQLTGRAVAPYVAPELRLLYCLEKYYGLPRKARFIRSGTRRAPGANDERRRSQPAGGIVLPPSVRLEPRRRGRSLQPLEHALPEAPAGFGSEEPTPLPRLAWAIACDRLDQATQRAQIGAIFVDFALGRFDALVVFLVRDANALGWHSRLATGSPAAPIDQLSLPLGLSSSFQMAHDGLRLYHGGAPTAGHPVESKLWEALGTPPPSDLMVAPVVVKQRVVNLIYAHGPAGAPLPDTDVAELAELAVRASGAYVRLIRKAKT